MEIQYNKYIERKSLYFSLLFFHFFLHANINILKQPSLNYFFFVVKLTMTVQQYTFIVISFDAVLNYIL